MYADDDGSDGDGYGDGDCDDSGDDGHNYDRDVILYILRNFEREKEGGSSC